MKQKYQFVSAASAVICGLSLLAVPANASISHVSSPHVSVTHTTPHVSSPHVSVTHATPHVSSPHVSVTHATPHVSVTHETPHVSSPHPSAPHFVTHSAGRTYTHHEPKVTKPAKSLNLAVKSQRRQLRLIRSAKHFSSKQTSRVFAANQVTPAYQTAYRHQSVISNPWFWLFMINHHRLSQQTQTDKHYLQGYQYGVKMGQKDLKKHSRYHQNLTSEQEKQHPVKWQKGYTHGYQDAVTPTAKQHQPVSAAAN